MTRSWRSLTRGAVESSRKPHGGQWGSSVCEFIENDQVAVAMCFGDGASHQKSWSVL